ncbi:MAG: 50S ribosomal protein L9 [Chloroflexota bacterium]|jgi:large subunit ribosomal protein L9|nr:50S ribosomal protein L9 [Chloroflexota bacterium]
MRVLLIRDVYKLGRAGEVKKVAAGYARNYLLPQGFAIPATQGAMQQAERIKEKATERRAALNEELSSVSEVLDGKALIFPVKASETGRLYGSVSSEDIIEAVEKNFEIELEKRQVEMEPIRELGTHKVPIHLTMDLLPEITVIVHREGEPPGEEKEESGEEQAEDQATEEEKATAVETAEEPKAEAESEELEESAEEPEVIEESEEATE